jgi:hypothetical protein
VQRLIQHGAKHIVVPGNLPNGCIPILLTLYASPDSSDYDHYGCLRKLNELARYHDDLLWRGVLALQIKHPYTKIAYADYYRPVLSFLQMPNYLYSVVNFAAKVLEVESNQKGPLPMTAS